MPVTIENNTDTRVLLRLNSGLNWHLGPREALELESVEVKGNAWIRRLEERGQVAVRESGAGKSRGARAQGPAAPLPETEETGTGDAQQRPRRGRPQQPSA